MKQLCKRSLALLMVLVMVIGLLPALTVQTNAATYTYNWGTRGTVADEDDFTRSTAEEWYAKYNTSYDELSALSGASSTSSVPSSALYTELKDLMTTAHSTKTSYDGTKSMYAYTDCQNGGGSISSFYSGKSIGPGWGEGGSWNREHTWPNSKGLGGQDENDIMMLRPTATSENSSRGNTAYGKSGSFYDPNEASNGKYNLHGDVARIVLYTYVRWGNTSYMWGSSGVMESKEVLLEWMEEDPVDTWELGRNDAVQSITGTRNVFVDYPELAFDMFNEDIPAGYDTPSGGAVSYKITATSSNTSYGTVSLSGKTITATPKTGYYASGYTVTSGSATVTQDGNIFTVNAQSDCTIRINFAAKKTVTVSFAGAGEASQTGFAGEAMSLPSVTAPEGYTFLGWMTSKLSTDTTTKPTNYYTNSFTPTASTTLYALYTYTVGGSGATEYVLTDLADINATDTTIITVTTSSGTVYAMNNDNGTSKAPAGVTVTVSSDGTVLTTEPADNLKWNVGGSADAYIFYPEGRTSSWLYCTSTNNGVRVGTTAANTFKIDSSGYLYHNGTGRYLGVYTTNPDWRCYTTNGGNIANQTLKFFVLREQGTTYYTGDPIKCEHTNTKNVAAVAATCTESGFTAGVFCNNCETYISGHEVVNALGHNYDSGKITTPATCTAGGVKTFTCQRCKNTKTEAVAATGHSYDAVVTAPTVYEQGYTTYTCSVCSHSYVSDYVEALGETYIVRFSVPSGVTAVANMECGKAGITLPDAGVPDGDIAYTFIGWAEKKVDNATDEPTVYAAGDTYIATAATTLYAVYSYVVASEDGGNGDYVKVTEAPTDWSGEYLIVYETGSRVFDGSRATLEAVSNYKSVTISDNTISAEEADAYKFIIAAMDGGYSIQSASGKYISGTSGSNKLNEGTSPSANTISIDANGNADIVSNTSHLRYNDASGQDRFRYYKSSTYTGQKAIALYVKNGSAGTTYYTTVIGCSHDNETAVDVLPTLTQQGYTQYICADCGEKLYEKEYTKAYTVDWNMTLKGDLSVNFQIDVHEALQDTLQIKVTFDGETDTYVGSCAASVNVAAAQMADQITIEFILGEETVTQTYTVKQYADTILADAAQSKYHQIVKDMLNYGAAAQTYFGYNTENLVNADINGAGTAEVPEAAGSELAVSGKTEGVGFYGATLLFRNKIAVRYYFIVSGDIADYNFTVNGRAYEPVQKDDYYYIEVADINPQDLDSSMTVLVNDGLSVSYSPMNYIVRMNQKGSENLQNLMKAMYNYHLEAKNVAAA